MDEFNQTVESIGERVGRDRSTIRNAVRLLILPLEAKRAIVAGQITESMGRTLLMMPNEELQLELMALAIKHKWNIRQAENYARGYLENGTKKGAKAQLSRTSPISRSLAEYLGTKVFQQNTAKGGKIIIEFYSAEELERI